MKNECPRCAMSVEPNQLKCAFCGAVLPVVATKIAAPKAEKAIGEKVNGEKTTSASEIGCLAVVAIFFVLIEIVLLLGALRFNNDPDTNTSRVWALIFGASTFVLLRSLWKKLR